MAWAAGERELEETGGAPAHALSIRFGVPQRRRTGTTLTRLVAALAALWIFVFFMVTALIR